MSQEKKVVAEVKLSEEEKLLKEKSVGFIEFIVKSNTEKITKETLEGLYEDTDDSNSYDVESGGEDSEDRLCDQVTQFLENRLSGKVILIT
jgi:hypothetical protein